MFPHMDLHLAKKGPNHAQTMSTWTLATPAAAAIAEEMVQIAWPGRQVTVTFQGPLVPNAVHSIETLSRHLGTVNASWQQRRSKRFL